MADDLTLMAVHAHPDDESSSTGGVLAAYGDAGVRTVVVTCTNGEFGDAPGGVKPGQDGHDEEAVAQLRLAELREACKILGVTDVEPLGYHDSGMPDWDYKDRPGAFCNVPVAEVAARIGALMERYRPQVVITYDATGPYQHPDHVHAARAAVAAAADTGIPAKVYFTAMRGSDWQKVWQALRDAGLDVPDRRPADPEIMRQMAETEAAHHHHDRHPAGARPQAGCAARAHQPDPGLLVQQDPPGRRRGGLRPGELHQGQRLHRGPRPRGRPVRRAPPAAAGPAVNPVAPGPRAAATLPGWPVSRRSSS